MTPKPGERIIDVTLTFKRAGLLIGYNADGTTAVVLWDDGALSFDALISDLGPWEPHHLSERKGGAIRSMMKIRLGVLRRMLREASSMTPNGSRAAPTDLDAQVPGHLPNELPGSAALDDEKGNPPQPGEVDELDEPRPQGVNQQAMVPGRWYGGEEPDGAERERLGDENGMDEADARMIDDNRGPTEDDPNDPDQGDMAVHLRGDEERTCLGTPKREEMGTLALGEVAQLNREIRRYMQQLHEEPAVASVSTDPTDTRGLYTAFDMAKDHGTGDEIQGTWYRSPGREAGLDGDPFRGTDPQQQLGFHVAKKDSTSPPAVSGEEGMDARRVKDPWPLGGGSDTSKMLGANARPDSVGSGDDGEGSEDADSGTDEEVEELGDDSDEKAAQGKKQG